MRLITGRQYPDRSILLIGAGEMGRRYATALRALGIRRVTVVSRSGVRAARLASEFGFASLGGAIEVVSSKLPSADLVIVALPIPALAPACRTLMRAGYRSILVEKPVALQSSVVAKLAREARKTNVRVQVGFNRLYYPSVARLRKHIAEDGGVVSCHYSATEFTHLISPEKYDDQSCQRWGIANSIHVVSLVHCLIGSPKQQYSQRAGGIEWHPSGAVFTGCGQTKAGVFYTYHSNWTSAGTWSIELMTHRRAYLLSPLEELAAREKGSRCWNRISVESAFPDVRPGMAEEVAAMLDAEVGAHFPSADLNATTEWIRIAEDVYGYALRAAQRQ